VIRRLSAGFCFAGDRVYLSLVMDNLLQGFKEYLLQKISLTGGLAEFTGSIGSATIAEAKVNTLSGPVSGLVEFLPAQVGSCTYPFRFIALSDQDYERLNSTLQYMRNQGFGEQ